MKQPTKRLLSEAEIILAENTDKLRAIFEERAKKFREKLYPLQEICPHPKIQRCSQEDFIMKHTGICPDCKKIILPSNIVRTLMNQY